MNEKEPIISIALKRYIAESNLSCPVIRVDREEILTTDLKEYLLAKNKNHSRFIIVLLEDTIMNHELLLLSEKQSTKIYPNLNFKDLSLEYCIFQGALKLSLKDYIIEAINSEEKYVWKA